MGASASHRLGRHKVRTMRTATGYRARVILGPRDFVDADAETLEGVLVKMEAALAERAVTTMAGRVDRIPTADEYLGALHRLTKQGEFGTHHQRMLAALHTRAGGAATCPSAAADRLRALRFRSGYGHNPLTICSPPPWGLLTAAAAAGADGDRPGGALGTGREPSSDGP